MLLPVNGAPKLSLIHISRVSTYCLLHRKDFLYALSFILLIGNYFVSQVMLAQQFIFNFISLASHQKPSFGFVKMFFLVVYRYKTFFPFCEGMAFLHASICFHIDRSTSLRRLPIVGILTFVTKCQRRYSPALYGCFLPSVLPSSCSLGFSPILPTFT